MTDKDTQGRRIDDKRPEGQLQWDGTNAVGTADVSRYLMVDLETLGSRPGCVVLSIGAAMFGPDGLGDSFHSAISLTSCTDAGLTIDPDTVVWWMNQSQEARDAAFVSYAPPLRDVLMAYTDWYLAHEPEKVWCHGAGFDAPIMEAAYRACGLRAPWHFGIVRDTRTLYDLAGVKVDRSSGTHHNALDDAINQARAAVEALRILRPRISAA